MTFESIDTLETQPLLNTATSESSFHFLDRREVDHQYEHEHEDATLLSDNVNYNAPSSPFHPPNAPNSILHNYIIINGLSSPSPPCVSPTPSFHPLSRRKNKCPAWLIFFSMCWVFLVFILFAFFFIYPSYFTVTIWKTSLDDSIPTPFRLQLVPPRIDIYTVSDVELYNPLIFPLYKFQFKVKAYYPRFTPPILLGASTKSVNLHVPARSSNTLQVPMHLTLNSTPEAPLLHVVLKLLDECQKNGTLVLDAFVNLTLAKNKIWNNLTFETYRRMQVPCH